MNSASWGWARTSLSLHELLLNLIPGSRDDLGEYTESVFTLRSYFYFLILLFSAVRIARWQLQLDDARSLAAIADIESDEATRAFLDAEKVISYTSVLNSVVFLTIPLLRF